MPDNAIGFIRSALSGNLGADTEAIVATAKAAGLHVPEIIIVGPDQAQPIVKLVEAVNRNAATTVIMPPHAETDATRRALDEALVFIVHSPAAEMKAGGAPMMPMPNVNELLNAMDGDVPADHKGAKVLGAAWALRHMDKWLYLDTDFPSTADGASPADVLNSLGWGNGCGKGAFVRWMRAELVARIDAAVPTIPGVGMAVLKVVDAQAACEGISAYCDTAVARAADQQLATARREYTELRNAHVEAHA